MKNLAHVFRTLAVLPMMALLLAASVDLAKADHDPALIHACVKNGNFRIVSNAGACKAKGATHITLATAAALTDLQNTNSTLQAEVDDLKLLARRLVGEKGAVLEPFGFSGGAPNMPGYFIAQAVFCDGDDTTLSTCDPMTGYVLQSGPLTANDEHSILTFDVGNTPNWSAIADLVTNGDDDIIKFEVSYYNPDDSFGGGGGTGATDRAWFFLRPQVSSGIDYVDLEGLDVESVSFVLDRVNLFYDQNTMQTTTDFAGRVFFNLAP